MSRGLLSLGDKFPISMFNKSTDRSTFGRCQVAELRTTLYATEGSGVPVVPR
jgi:hypothetical protein